MTVSSFNQQVPYGHLSGFYALYFALLGCIAPFWGLYLQAQKFSAQDIGLLLALFSMVRIFAPNMWAALNHRFPDPMRLVRLANILMLVCFGFIFFAQSLWQFAAVMIAYGFFWSAVLPQYEAITLRYLKDDIDSYSAVRVWGSVGFILVVLLLGFFFDWFSIIWLPVFMAVFMLCLVVNSFAIKSPQTHDEQIAAVQSIEWSFPVVSFLVVSLLLQIAHGPYYAFFSIYLEGLDYDKWLIGLLWCLGVVAEIFVFWKFSSLTKKITIYQLTTLSLIITALRWVLTALFADLLLVLLLCQLMHAFSFGVLHATAVKYISHFFPAALQAKGQALYSGLGFGLGGAIGAWASGLGWQTAGGQMIFLFAAMVSVVAVAVCYIGLRKIRI